ncbi:MAG: hypothetical protein HGA19_16645, partial [Oscillochloris sp.]|nr:hypothetical protein [Oscillochloris sp.]
MDWMLFIGIVSVGLILILFVLVMLNRAWGDFPGRISGLPPVMPPNSSPPPPSAMMSSMSSSLAGMGEIPSV